MVNVCLDGAQDHKEQTAGQLGVNKTRNLGVAEVRDRDRAVRS